MHEVCKLHSGFEEKIKGNSQRIIEQRDICHDYQDKVWKQLTLVEGLVRKNGGSKVVSTFLQAFGTGIGLGLLYLAKGLISK